MVQDRRPPARPVDQLIGGRREAIAALRCMPEPIGCGRDFTVHDVTGEACDASSILAEFRDELSRREYQISGLCQKCQDEVFQELPEELEGMSGADIEVGG